MLALVLSAFPSLTLPECAGGFIAAGLDLRKFELYDTWFDENSTVKLVQTGVYQGVDDIKEYLQFIQPGSPYISANGLLYDEKSIVNFDEEKRSCVFLSLAHNRFQMSEMGGNELFETAWFSTMEWRFDDQKIGRIEVFGTPALLAARFLRPTAHSTATRHGGCAAVTLCADPASLVAVQLPRISSAAFSLPS